jgi:carbonic anhydrase
LFITCADSRVVPNLITTSGPGDLFTIRNVGDIVPAYGSGDASVGAGIEYAVDVLGVSTITVCGHSGCGAVRALMNGSAGTATALGSWLAESRVALSASDDEENCIIANVAQQIENILSYPSVRKSIDEGRLSVTGLYFDLAEARMYAVDGGVRKPVNTA